MRIKLGGSEAGGCEPATSSVRRSGTIARRSAILLGGTAAMALSITQPASDWTNGRDRLGKRNDGNVIWSKVNVSSKVRVPDETGDASTGLGDGRE
ncbi:MAG: hypothetical protein WAV78_18610 [Xanthobacteraceae bacterium]